VIEAELEAVPKRDVMSGKDDYTDDYVAELLKRDAKATSSAASNLGIGSLTSKR